MLISAAHAATGAAAQVPSAGETLTLNLLMVLVLVVMFYVLLIMPQQRRFKEHAKMLKGVQKGDNSVPSSPSDSRLSPSRNCNGRTPIPTRFDR